MPAEIRALPQFMSMKPTAHGGYFLLMDGNVVLVVPYGTWGTRCTNNYINDATALLKSSDIERLGAIVVLDDWQLGTPDAIAKLRAFNQAASEEFGVFSECLVGQTNSAALQITEQRIAKSNPELEIFSKLSDAMDWFIEKGFEFSQLLFQNAYDNRAALLAESKR